jgi:hypothetical protein
MEKTLASYPIGEEKTTINMPTMSLAAGIYPARFVTTSGSGTIIKLEYQP